MSKKNFVLLTSVLVVSSTPLISVGTNVFANENTEISLNQSIDENMTEQEIAKGLNQLANLKMDDLITILEQQGIDPSTIFTAKEMAQQRKIEMLIAGVNKVFNVNNETKDIYLNSYIATTAKTVGLAAVVHYVSLGWLAQAITGSIGANINTSKGIIARVNKQSGWKWGSNIDRWVIISVRSQ